MHELWFSSTHTHFTADKIVAPELIHIYYIWPSGIYLTGERRHSSGDFSQMHCVATATFTLTRYLDNQSLYQHSNSALQSFLVQKARFVRAIPFRATVSSYWCYSMVSLIIHCFHIHAIHVIIFHVHYFVLLLEIRSPTRVNRWLRDK